MKHTYKPYQQDLMLLKGIADIHPYQCRLPDLPPIENITNYGLHPDSQYFQREKIPYELVKIDKAVKAQLMTREEGIAAIESDSALVAFVEMLWRKRTGEELVFQIIHGAPTYISPTYWFYLNFWNLDTGLPDFRTDKFHNCGDLEEFYCWDLLVVPSEYCCGLTELSGRRGGKTFKGGVIVYEPISRNYEWHGYVQSKTDSDAGEAFTKAIVKPWRKLPFFFQPIYSNSSFPKKEGLQFAPRSSRGKDGSQIFDDECLMSSIEFVSSETIAIDGRKAHRILEDETGKTKDLDTYARHNVNKYTLMEKGRYVGKKYDPTTVEEMEKMGGKYYKAKWDDSDRSPIQRGQKPITVDENGETVSGLWTWFIPAYCNEIFDQWGEAIVDSTTEKNKAFLKESKYKYWWMTGKEAIDKQIDSAGKNKGKQQEIIRKKPRNIKEAFASSLNFCLYNRAILDDRLKHFIHGYTNEELPVSEYAISEIQNEVIGQTAQAKADWVYSPGVRWGRFEWIDPLKPYKCGVYFQPTSFEDAKFHINHLLDPGMRNKWTVTQNGKWKPANAAKFRSGADPFKYNTPDVKNKDAMSLGAQHIYMFQDSRIDYGKPREKWVSQNLVFEYLWRPELKAELFEDYAKACIYFGCKLYPERNIDEVLDHFKRNGLEYYIHLGIRVATKGDQIGYKQETVGGDITNTLVIQNMHRHNADFVNNDACACIFYRTLQQLRDLENDFNPFDLAASVAYTLMASFEADIANKAMETPSILTKADIEEFTLGLVLS